MGAFQRPHEAHYRQIRTLVSERDRRDSVVTIFRKAYGDTRKMLLEKRVLEKLRTVENLRDMYRKADGRKGRTEPSTSRASA